MIPGIVRRTARRALYRKTPVPDRPPPECPAGWRTGPPDFVGIGVQRSGTSWWYNELARHPDCSQAPGTAKELHFFDSLSDRELTDELVARYRRWFPHPDGAIAGEWTPAYVYQPWSVPMLAHAAPEARVLLLLRDPIARFCSGLRFNLSRGSSHSSSTLEAFHRGLYAGQVARVLEHVSRDRLLVLLYEELVDEPERQRSRTAGFVGLDPDRFPRPVRLRASKSSGSADDTVPAALLAELRARYRDDRARLALLLPELDLGRWKSLDGG